MQSFENVYELFGICKEYYNLMECLYHVKDFAVGVQSNEGCYWVKHPWSLDCCKNKKNKMLHGLLMSLVSLHSWLVHWHLLPTSTACAGGRDWECEIAFNGEFLFQNKVNAKKWALKAPRLSTWWNNCCVICLYQQSFQSNAFTAN